MRLLIAYCRARGGGRAAAAAAAAVVSAVTATTSTLSITAPAAAAATISTSSFCGGGPRSKFCSSSSHLASSFSGAFTPTLDYDHDDHSHEHDHRRPLFRHVTVEWSPKVAQLYHSRPELFESSSSIVVTHWVFPDLPQIYTPEHRQSFYEMTAGARAYHAPHHHGPRHRQHRQRMIQTLATCHHETWQSLVATAKERLLPAVPPTMDDNNGNNNDKLHSYCNGGKLLLVGGNDKKKSSTKSSTISTVEAAKILRAELGDDLLLSVDEGRGTTTNSQRSSSDAAGGTELWAVADPNDPDSPSRVQAKIEAGITGFLTQPLLTSTAWDTFQSYHNYSCQNEIETRGVGVSFVAGMALPRTARNLQFWKQLVDRPELLDDDPLFQSHLAYFSQPYTTPLAWIGRELQQYITAHSAAAASSSSSSSSSVANDRQLLVDGVHFMPLQNTEDLAVLLQSLSSHRSMTTE